MLLDRDALNPVQRQVLEDLLAVDSPRPPGDAAVADRLEKLLTTRTEAAANLIPEGDAGGLFISKGRLDALSCDGRFIDQAESEFAFSPAIVRGTLAHTGIDVDLAGQRTRDPLGVLAHAWERIATSGTGAGEFLTTLGGAEADALRADALRILLDFRDQFPLLPPTWEARTEPGLRVRLHGGRVVLLGRPDLRIGRPTADYRRMLLIDFKTGGRHPLRHRADMRLYALLATLKHRVAPFRVATFYLDEAAWDIEDVDEDVLEAAARDVALKIQRAAILSYARPPEDEWQLTAGPACGWCQRAPACPAKAEAEAEYALAHPRG